VPLASNTLWLLIQPFVDYNRGVKAWHQKQAVLIGVGPVAARVNKKTLSRYAKNEDFKNFIKLAHMSPWLHHSGGTIVEPMDLPVNKRHLDMVYNHIKYSDKCFMGSVTAPERAQESADTLFPTMLAGINVVFQAAGWLEGGLTMGYEKFILDTAHTMANYKTAFYDSSTANHESFEQWQEEGSLTAAQRANRIYKKMLNDYELPPLDADIDARLVDYMNQRKAAFADSNV